MSSGLTSSLSDLPKGRSAAEPSNRPPRYRIARNLLATARLWLGKLLSFRYARVLMIFVVGFAAGVVWQSYGSAARTTIAGWSPYLGWLAPSGASASYNRIRADLAAARQNLRQSLDKLDNDISRLEAQGANVPRRRADR